MERSNILGQVFSTSKKNQIWVDDITYIPTKHGFLHLAVCLGIFSRKVVGWAMDTRVKDTLAMSALNQAVGRERPGKGLIVHTDQGAQYTSKRFCALLQRHGFSQSMEQKRQPLR